MCRIPQSDILLSDKSLVLTSVSSGTATIRFNVPENGHVKLNMLCPNGRLASRIIDEYKSAASYSVLWRIPHSLSAGVYYIVFSCGDIPVQTNRIILSDNMH
jgi:hypothetical protein